MSHPIPAVRASTTSDPELEQAQRHLLAQLGLQEGDGHWTDAHGNKVVVCGLGAAVTATSFNPEEADFKEFGDADWVTFVKTAQAGAGRPIGEPNSAAAVVKRVAEKVPHGYAVTFKQDATTTAIHVKRQRGIPAPAIHGGGMIAARMTTPSKPLLQ